MREGNRVEAMLIPRKKLATGCASGADEFSVAVFDEDTFVAGASFNAPIADGAQTISSILVMPRLRKQTEDCGLCISVRHNIVKYRSREALYSGLRRVWIRVVMYVCQYMRRCLATRYQRVKYRSGKETRPLTLCTYLNGNIRSSEAKMQRINNPLLE
jgi:predicted aconitase